MRVMVTGETHTPSIDATLELIGRDAVLTRMDDAFPGGAHRPGSDPRDRRHRRGAQEGGRAAAAGKGGLGLI